MGVLDMLKGTQLGNLFSGGGAVMGAIGNVLILAVVAALIVGVVYVVSKTRRFNIPTPVFSKRSGTLKFFVDKASYTKDKKTNLWDFRFKSLKEIKSPPPYKVLLTGLKGNNVAVYYQNSAGELYPCEVEVIEPKEEEEVDMEVLMPDGKIGIVKTKIAKCKLKIIEPDIALWSTQMDEKLIETYGNKTWWDKYGNQVLFFGAAALTLVLIYLVLKKIDVVAEAARLFRESIDYLKASGVKTISPAP